MNRAAGVIAADAASKGRLPRSSPPTLERLAWVAAGLFVAGLFVSTLYLLTPLFFAAPFQDQWVTIGEYRRALKRGLSLPLLFSQHNEHRLIFPRLVLFADMHFFGGLNNFSRTVTLAGLVTGAGLMALIARRGGRGVLPALAGGLAAGVMVSMLHWQNILWGFQVQFVWVFVAAAWSAYLFFRAARDAERTRWGLMAGALALLVVATFCMANGLVAGWAVMAVALVTRRPLRPTLALGVATLALTLIYLNGYHEVGEHSDPTLALQKPKEFAYYVAMYLGSIAAEWGKRAAFLFGLAGFGAAGAAGLWVLIGRERRPEGLALVAVLAFLTLTAMVTGVGRLSFGIEQAVSPRYLTPSALFWAALTLFWALQAAKARWLQVPGCVAVVAGAVALIHLQGAMLRYASETAHSVELAVDVVLSGTDDPDALNAFFADAGFVTPHLGFLRDSRLSFYRGEAVGWVGRPLSAIGESAPRGACLGYIDGVVRAPRGTASRASGWAWDVAGDAAPRRLVIVDSTARIVGLASGGRPRPDVRKAVKQVRSGLSGWAGTAPQAGPISIHAVLKDGRTCEIGRRP